MFFVINTILFSLLALLMMYGSVGFNFQKLKRESYKNKMFTGIIEEIGTVDFIRKSDKVKLWDGSISEGVELSILCKNVVSDAYTGCSISVNGVCLTVTEFDSEKFRVGLAPETLRRSNLRLAETGFKVNLERAAKIDGRNSGHVVQGHVDNTGVIVEKWRDGESLFIKVQAPVELMKYIVPKGFIAIDGTSLTICEVNGADSSFTFMLIAHTQANVIIPSKQVGDLVNIEVDVTAKLLEKSLDNAIALLAEKTTAITNSLLARISSLEMELSLLKSKI